MSTKTIIIAGIALTAIVLLAILADAAARDWAIAGIATIITLLIRGGDHAIRSDDQKPPTATILPILLVSAAIMSCSGPQQIEDFGGAEITAGVSPDGAFHAEGRAGMSVDMVDGETSLEVDLEDGHHYVLFSASIVAYDVFGATLELDCDLSVPVCEVCLIPLSSKDSLWCTSFGDTTE